MANLDSGEKPKTSRIMGRKNIEQNPTEEILSMRLCDRARQFCAFWVERSIRGIMGNNEATSQHIFSPLWTSEK